jgi:hypothetical protein
MIDLHGDAAVAICLAAELGAGQSSGADELVGGPGA